MPSICDQDPAHGGDRLDRSLDGKVLVQALQGLWETVSRSFRLHLELGRHEGHLFGPRLCFNVERVGLRRRTSARPLWQKLTSTTRIPLPFSCSRISSELIDNLNKELAIEKFQPWYSCSFNPIIGMYVKDITRLLSARFSTIHRIISPFDNRWQLQTASAATNEAPIISGPSILQTRPLAQPRRSSAIDGAPHHRSCAGPRSASCRGPFEGPGRSRPMMNGTHFHWLLLLSAVCVLGAGAAVLPSGLDGRTLKLATLHVSRRASLRI